MTNADWYYAIDAQYAGWDYATDARNYADCWENLTIIGNGLQGGWQAGYEFYRWYISLKTCPKRKYSMIRLTLDKNDGKGAFTVCRKEL